MTRKITVNGPEGAMEVDVSELRVGNIQHRSLSQPLLNGIRCVYNVLRESLTHNDYPMKLETFEVIFMRDPDPARSLKVWEQIAVAYRQCLPNFPVGSGKKILKILMVLAMNGQTVGEMGREDFKIIAKVFAEVAENEPLS